MFLVYMAIKVTVKLCIWALVIELWLCWALIALPVALIANLAGNKRVSRQWMRSMNWSRALRL